MGTIVELRQRLGDLLHPRYDTDFNLLRWIINAEKMSSSSKSVLDLAEKQLRNHLRFRKTMKLDEIDIPSFDENPMFKEKLLPQGSVTLLESTNRYLWWTDYETMDITGIVKARRTSDMLMYHFYLYEQLLRLVNQRERQTGQMSGIDCVIDFAHYDLNPFALLIVNNGQLSYYITVFHYEQYPQLVCPIWTINIPKWMYIPYRMARGFLPKDVSDRIRILDSNFKQTLKNEYEPKELPEYLGGELKDDHLRTIPARRFTQEELNQFHEIADHTNQHQDLTHVQIGARKRKYIHFEVTQPDTEIKFFFRSDGDFVFGFFYHRADETKNNHKKHTKNSDVDPDAMDMIKAPIRIGARFVPEGGSIYCKQAGTYYMLLCNKQSWLFRCNVYFKLEFAEQKNNSRVLHRTFSD